MVRILLKNEKTAPVVVCDQCQQPIINAGMGMVAFEHLESEGNFGDVAFLHKGDCDKQYKGGRNRKGGWVELTHFLADICDNCKVNMSEARESRDRLRSALG